MLEMFRLVGWGWGLGAAEGGALLGPKTPPARCKRCERVSKRSKHRTAQLSIPHIQRNPDPNPIPNLNP